ncbi:MAG: pyruvate, water dikinase regulatory protein [Marinilabiliaceae bacterium]|jgi:regulator of PEP synthase PpsR (kinase-PPPase family)|nr:pyruvate, water dikinase regulatory protein [Marinilabiliaceae bacterium]
MVSIENKADSDCSDNIAPIYVVSGGKGMAANTLVQSVLIQFPDNRIPLIVVPNVDSMDKVKDTVIRAKESCGVIVHTMVDPLMREILLSVCESYGVKHFDLVGDLSDHISALLQKEPISKPGLYRLRNIEYFSRVEAIEFTMKHDDGLNVEKISKADIVLAGVSRTGKTPLSIYMGMFGWKVANVPLVPGIEPPPELFIVDSNRVFGLTTTPHYLIAQRTNRVKQLGLRPDDDYITPRSVRDELEYANRIFKRGGFKVFNITNKPIESTANEILTILTDTFGQDEWRKPGER